jgi:DNA (cytosine-5)-methyltransferase 1
MGKKMEEVDNLRLNIENVLDEIYVISLEIYNKSENYTPMVDPKFTSYIDDLCIKAEVASAAFNNIITGLAIKLAFNELDVRFHQTQIQESSSLKKSWFNHRGLSEKVVYPWLSLKNFSGAKSGWQTRTLERPKPYTRNYDENISYVKESFLEIYEATHEQPIDVIKSLLVYLFYKQIIIREGRVIDLATPNIDEIATIVAHLKKHIMYKYSGKGGSRLPVLAIYATLQLVSKEISRYSDLKLKKLEEHSAADSQTGSAGDIEFENKEHKIIEALEIKHGIVVTKEIIQDTGKKISPFQLNRYYVLTTADQCKPNDEQILQLQILKQKIGCQIIVNGVFPTIQYYLRLVQEPQKVYKAYTDLLATDNSVTHEHREIWNEIILGS